MAAGRDPYFMPGMSSEQLLDFVWSGFYSAAALLDRLTLPQTAFPMK